MQFWVRHGSSSYRYARLGVVPYKSTIILQYFKDIIHLSALAPQDVGQKLCDDVSEARETIQRMRMDNAKRLTATETLEMDTLIDWLSFSSRAPIRPMDVFDMNYSSGASILGLILTYMIILLQFKVTEMTS